jgi:hypothetical protein
MVNFQFPIVSVHTPKAAGTSFIQQLRTTFGEDSLLLDYSEDPADVRSRQNMDPESYRLELTKSIFPFRVVHGHYHISKYDGLSDAFRLTFLRHPIDNLLSIYDFWSLQSIDTWDNPLFKYFKEKSLPPERFAMLPTIRYLYTRTYFGGFDMSRFDFIGDYQHYSTELFRLGALLGVGFEPSVRLNVTQNLPGYQPRINSVDRAILGELLVEDILFYEKYVGK